MLSLFPELYDWSWYVPFFFRMFLAAYLISLGYEFALRGDREKTGRLTFGLLGGLFILISACFFIGLYTQLAAAAGFSLAVLALFTRSRHPFIGRESNVFYILIGIVSLSLIFLGPGPFAFDLPL